MKHTSYNKLIQWAYAERNIFQLINSSTFISVVIVYADEGAGESENLTKSDEDGVMDFS